MQASSTHPLLILNEIDSACRKIIGDTVAPVQEKDEIWSGVGFRIADDDLVIKNSYIDKIMSTNFQQDLSAVPGAKPWLLGLISLRGQPLSIIDLKQYLYNKPSQKTENSRLIVVKKNEYISGLLLENVYGLKQFPIDSKINDSASNDSENETKIADNIKPFIDGIFDDNGISRGNLSISRLVSNEDFANAAR